MNSVFYNRVVTAFVVVVDKTVIANEVLVAVGVGFSVKVEQQVA